MHGAGKPKEAEAFVHGRTPVQAVKKGNRSGWGNGATGGAARGLKEGGGITGRTNL